MAAALYTIAVPRLSPGDEARLREVRRHREPRFGATVPPHFTLVFACDSIAQDVYIRTVEAVAAETAPIEFRLSSAELSAPRSDEDAHVFLVPGAGRAELTALHERFYSALAAPGRRPGPFVPHVTVATDADRTAAHTLCDAWTRDGVDIAGRVDEVIVCSLDGERLMIAARVPLEGGRARRTER